MISSDADWASDSERRRSVDCVHIYHGGHLIEGIVRGAASGIQLREAFMQFGFSVRLRGVV